MSGRSTITSGIITVQQALNLQKATSWEPRPGMASRHSNVGRQLLAHLTTRLLQKQSEESLGLKTESRVASCEILMAWSLKVTWNPFLSVSHIYAFDSLFFSYYKEIGLVYF